MSHKFIFKNNPPDIGPVSTRYEWCCIHGCGECKPVLVEYRVFVRTCNGELEAQETQPRMVSDCCGDDMFLWDSETDSDGPTGYDGQLFRQEATGG